MKATIPLEIVKLDKGSFHLFLTLLVNNQPARVVVDTGASRSVFDKTLISTFLIREKIKPVNQLSTGLGTNGMESYSVKISSLGIGNLTIKNYSMVLLDLTHVIQSYEDLGRKPPLGVLGSDIFMKYRAVINYQKKILVLDSVKK
jgi:predicted aspartyl protease